jgi:hypothetical protein
VSGLNHITLKIVVGKYGAAYAGHTDGLPFDTKLVNRFRNKAVYDTVRTAGAIVKRNVTQ